jgi:hypothetical protein
MSPVQGIAITIDAEFRRTNFCGRCELAIGDKPFVVNVTVNENPSRVWYEHIDCRQKGVPLQR